jgi:NADPH:quinone reductase-like Zn-dependent oxidoreductase
MTYLRPEPGAGTAGPRKGSGVGHWDSLIREGKIPSESLPLILGFEQSGIVKAIGPEVSGFTPGDEIHGARNDLLNGALLQIRRLARERISEIQKCDVRMSLTRRSPRLQALSLTRHS